MWQKSNSGGQQIGTPTLYGNVAREVSAYLTIDQDGQPVLFVFNSMANTSNSSVNPSIGVGQSSGERSFLGNELLAQIHTHPDYVRPDGTFYSANYSGSPDDQAASKLLRGAVLTLTSTTFGVTIDIGSRAIASRDLGNDFRTSVMGGNVNELVRVVTYYNSLIPRR